MAASRVTPAADVRFVVNSSAKFLFQRLSFVNGINNCSSNFTSAWTYTEDAPTCARTYSSKIPINYLLQYCGFARDERFPAITSFCSTLTMETWADGGLVRDTPLVLYKQYSASLCLGFPTNITAAARDIQVYSSRITVAEITRTVRDAHMPSRGCALTRRSVRQVFAPTTQVLTATLITSVQYPCALWLRSAARGAAH
jgi:hypothetical protein